MEIESLFGKQITVRYVNYSAENFDIYNVIGLEDVMDTYPEIILETVYRNWHNRTPKRYKKAEMVFTVAKEWFDEKLTGRIITINKDIEKFLAGELESKRLYNDI